MLRSLPLCHLKGGFGSIFHSEALAGALPRYQNSPQRVPYGLYTELLSGSSFTVPRAKNQFSWVYRMRPSVCHHPSEWKPFTSNPLFSSENVVDPLSPEQWRFRALPSPSIAVDFIDGLATLATNGEGASVSGFVFSENSMRILKNCDAETLLVPQLGGLRLTTELGVLEVFPGRIALIPRGLIFRVETMTGEISRGYMLENFGSNFQLPELGPIGVSSGLAHPRHFEAPAASFEEKGTYELVVKLRGKLFSAALRYSPFDVVAWYGTLAPLRYDLRLFMPVNSVAFDHPDPSIGCVLQSPSAIPGESNLDFVIFPPRWMVAENSFRPPWFHRNVMSEFMGLLWGEYDAKKGESFQPGGSSIHNRHLPHGPDLAAVENGLEISTSVHQRYQNTMAFMFETNTLWIPTQFAADSLKDKDYMKCWQGLDTRFDTNCKAEQHLPFNPEKQEIF